MSQQDLKISLLQTELYWEESEANLASIEEMIWEEPLDTDLLILPEMFNSGFSMNASKIAEPIRLRTFKWMEQQAKQLQAAVVGSFAVSEDGNYYNRLIWMFPDGCYEQYDKRHLFSLAGETEHYTAGAERPIIEWGGWRFFPQICYDLRFPVWSRNWMLEDGSLAYDCVLYIANWPTPRVNAWRILLQARAVENLAYSLGVNRIGKDEKGLNYNGQSMAVDPKGHIMIDPLDQKGIFHTVLEAEPLNKFREKFAVYLDADKFTLG